MTTRTKNSKEPVKGDLKVTPSPEKIESPVKTEEVASAPVNLEVETPTAKAVEAPAPASKETVETDVRKKLSRKTDDNSNPFVPANPAQVEADAKRVAADSGFELNRGTSVGARLMARAQSRPGQ